MREYPAMAKGIGDREDYWKQFWIGHAKAAADSHPQHQVLRTLNKKPISEEEFKKIVSFVEEKLSVNSADDVLDLCCGNGLFTTVFASKCNSVTGIDVAKELTDQIDTERHKNITTIVKDIREVKLKEQSYSKIFMYAGLQYFAYKEVIGIFQKVSMWLKDDGKFYIGDVPDVNQMWNFFNTEEREKVYFESLVNGTPIIGTWFDSGWLTKLGKFTDFRESEILDQPSDFPYSYYRFDMLFRK
jgi:cyclopropane fatty-acyl-phospholipid synthase-like methyltransferase